jgi:hypothetical protein
MKGESGDVSTWHFSEKTQKLFLFVRLSLFSFQYDSKASCLDFLGSKAVQASLSPRSESIAEAPQNFLLR